MQNPTGLRPKEFALAHTPKLCEAIGLPWIEGGYGLLFCEDGAGAHWTVMTTDTDYIRLIAAVEGTGTLANLQLPAEKFPLRRQGWPDEWAAR